ncbi:hypothetical protein NA57DRAFT_70100 [Rhizodiscina lignyota]|uniref:Uncharacterized protein n=1 Tax=Rhizodiscina lignyota TaxID=1504668 RepID=A0A9P4IR79_9PEZI|nr:hypothetical protein NA57DRAFT_70100 [Rhizodiscina lignyota]
MPKTQDHANGVAEGALPILMALAMEGGMPAENIQKAMDLLRDPNNHYNSDDSYSSTSEGAAEFRGRKGEQRRIPEDERMKPGLETMLRLMGGDDLEAQFAEAAPESGTGKRKRADDEDLDEGRNVRAKLIHKAGTRITRPRAMLSRPQQKMRPKLKAAMSKIAAKRKILSSNDVTNTDDQDSDSGWETVDSTNEEESESDDTSDEDEDEDDSSDSDSTMADDQDDAEHEERTTLIPHDKRPRKPSFHAGQANAGAASLMQRLQSFLPQIRDANAELEAVSEAGKLDSEAIEIVEDAEAGAEEGNEDNNTGNEGEGEQYVEMNLWPGVLEDKSERPGDEDDENDSDDGEDRENDAKVDVMAKLMGRKKRKRSVGIKEV